MSARHRLGGDESGGFIAQPVFYRSADAFNEGNWFLFGNRRYQPLAQELQETGNAMQPLRLQSFFEALWVEFRSSFNVLPQQEPHVVDRALEFGQQRDVEVSGLIDRFVRGGGRLHGKPVKIRVNRG